MSEDDLIATMGTDEAQEEATGNRSISPIGGSLLLASLTIEAWQLFWKALLHRITLLTLLILTLVGLTALIRYQTYRVSEGHSLGPTVSILTGLRRKGYG